MQMHTMRRRGLAAAPSAPAAAKASSQGKARDTPAIRRKRRRSCFMGSPHAVFTLLRHSLVLKQLALDNLVNERPKAIVLATNLANDDRNFRLVILGRRCPCRVRQQLPRQSAGQTVLVLDKQLF